MLHRGFKSGSDASISSLLQIAGVIEQVLLRVSMVTTDFKGAPVMVPHWATFLEVDLVLASGTTWSTAKMDLEWSLTVGTDETDRDIEQFNVFIPARRMSTSLTNLRSVPVFGLGYVRLVCSTAASGSDPDATALLRFS